MQGINKTKHAHLMDALLGLEKLVIEQDPADCCILKAAEYHGQLGTMFSDYERLLTELSILICDYEILCSEVKVQFLGKKLKEIKKDTAVEKPAFAMLCSSIRLAYGT